MKKLLSLLLVVGLVGCAQRVPPVAVPVNEKKPTVPRAVDAADEKLPSEWAKELNHPDAKIHEAAANALREMGEVAVPALVALLKNADSATQVKAMLVLSEIGEHANDATPALRNALKSEDVKVREHAAQALALTHSGPDGKTVADLVVTLKDESTPVRAMAAWSLGHMGMDSEAAVPALILSLKDKETSVQLNVIEALGFIGAEPEEAIPALTEFLSHKDETFRLQALMALRAFGEPAVPVIVQALKTSDAAMRARIFEELCELGSEAAGAVPAITAALKDPDKKVREKAEEALKRIDPEAAKKAGLR